jgi:hypothetical protein
MTSGRVQIGIEVIPQISGNTSVEEMLNDARTRYQESMTSIREDTRRGDLVRQYGVETTSYVLMQSIGSRCVAQTAETLPEEASAYASSQTSEARVEETLSRRPEQGLCIQTARYVRLLRPDLTAEYRDRILAIGRSLIFHLIC